MLVSDFQYVLPPELIAQRPSATRGSSRMLRLDRRSGAYIDGLFTDLPSLLSAGDLLVLNDSRVLPARLFATRSGVATQTKSPPPSGVVEVLLTQRLYPLRPLDATQLDNDWTALVRPAKKVRVGETLLFHGANSEAPPLLRATVLSAGDFGERTLRFDPTPDFYALLERLGHLPLPPYIHRSRAEPNTAEDRERYQTVYSEPLSNAHMQGSAAAPTAGLHFTPLILEQLNKRGVEVATVTLHVGLGTFQPTRALRTEDIRLHAEPYSLSAATAAGLLRARDQGRRIIAVGTTTTRVLEHVAREAERTRQTIAAHSGETSLFLAPNAEPSSIPHPTPHVSPNAPFRLVSGLLTNFHLPQSTLLMLVSAFAGREHVLAAYAHAVAARYRFFSYGDCMLIL